MIAGARRRDWAGAGMVALAAGALLLWMGRGLICKCGEIKLWHGQVVSSENSQHLADWYSPSHILHGLIFYAVLALVLPRVRMGLRLLIATVVEAAWEIAENTDAVIERYREATIALDYYGDSVVNSMADIAMMWLGFLIAARAPVWVSVLIFIAAELIVGWLIRDGLTLNVIMLLWPQDWIAEWQNAR